MRGACYMTVIPLYVADTLGAGPADIGRVLPTLSSHETTSYGDTKAVMLCVQVCSSR